MFKKWNKKRLIKKIQNECFHEYHIVSTYDVDVGETTYIWKPHHDMYCPKCDKTVYEVADRKAKREIERQKLRNEYKESYQ